MLAHTLNLKLKLTAWLNIQSTIYEVNDLEIIKHIVNYYWAFDGKLNYRYMRSVSNYNSLLKIN